MSDVKHIDIAEFRQLGFVSEINRRFLHPMGLALEVTVDEETGAEHISGVWDYRDDPEGIYYGDDQMDDVAAKARRLHTLFGDRAPARYAALGFVVQPVAKEMPR